MTGPYLRIGVLILLMKSEIPSSQITFQKAFGGAQNETGSCVSHTIDGGYILVGSTGGFEFGGADVYLIKTDAEGDTLWTRTYGGTSEDNGNSVQQTADGGYIVAGRTYSFGAGNADVYVLKTDANGDTMWTKTFGGPGYDFAWEVQQSDDKGYILTGLMNSVDVYLIKTDSSATPLWSKILGGSMYDVGVSVSMASDGGYILTGTTNSFSSGELDVYVIKTNPDGETVWAKTFGGDGDDVGQTIKQIRDGGFIICGFTNSFDAPDVYDVYLIKIDSLGRLLWSKTYGGVKHEMGYSVQQTLDEGFIIAGHTSLTEIVGHDDFYIIRTDMNGDTLWTKTYGGAGSDKATSVQQSHDGGYVIVGSTNSFGAGGTDIHFIKTDANGNSDCSGSSTTLRVTHPATQIKNATTVVSSGGSAMHTATIVGSGGTTITLCSPVAMDELTFNRPFRIYPNPVSDLLFVDELVCTESNFQVIDMTGKVVLQERIERNAPGPTKIHTTELSLGLYFIRIWAADLCYTRQFIKLE